MRKYKPATFQPTVRPDWAGVLSYLSDKEKGEILEAILKYPSFETESRFFNETVKPDLDMQFAEFVRICQARQRGINIRWQKNRESQDSAEKRGKISIPYVDDMNNSSCSYVVVPEGEGEEEGKGGGERKGKGKSKEIDSFHLEKQDDNQDESNSKKQRKSGIDLSFLSESFLKETFERFLAYRKEIKKPYKSQMSVEQAFSELQKLSGGVLETAEAIVNQSIANGWQGIFPLTNEKQRISKPVCDYDALLNVDLSGIGEN